MSPCSAARLSRSHYDALTFDLDGVVTSAAVLHMTAWQRLFDEFLSSVRKREGVDTSPLALPDDYLQHVDGKPRADGLRDCICVEVLETAGLKGVFDASIDGNDLAAEGLAGTPDPVMFLQAAGRLSVRPGRVVVFGDAASGVEELSELVVTNGAA